MSVQKEDIYETEDVPLEEELTVVDSMNEPVELLHVSMGQALARFKPHSLTSDNVDFSDSLTASGRGYVLELAGERIHETAEQKLTRLRCELTELVDLLANQPVKEPSLLADDVAQLQKALANLQSTPPSSGPATIRKGDNARESSSTDQKESSTEERMASVEARIRRAEQTMGGGGRRALGEAVDELRMRVQLIQPSTIEALESRLNALVTRQQGQNKATPDKAVMEMHDLCRRWDVTCQSLPALVTRLQGLRVLHEQAGEATALLAQAEGARMAMTKAVEGDRLAMHDLRLHLSQQTTAIEQRLLAMEKRLSTLGK